MGGRLVGLGGVDGEQDRRALGHRGFGDRGACVGGSDRARGARVGRVRVTGGPRETGAIGRSGRFGRARLLRYLLRLGGPLFGRVHRVDAGAGNRHRPVRGRYRRRGRCSFDGGPRVVLGREDRLVCRGTACQHDREFGARLRGCSDQGGEIRQVALLVATRGDVSPQQHGAGFGGHKEAAQGNGIVLVCAYGIYVSIDWLVTWLSQQHGGFVNASHLGWLSGWLMVLPNTSHPARRAAVSSRFRCRRDPATTAIWRRGVDLASSRGHEATSFGMSV